MGGGEIMTIYAVFSQGRLVAGSRRSELCGAIELAKYLNSNPTLDHTYVVQELLEGEL